MKKLAVVVLVLLLLFVAVAPVGAAGDKVHGDNAQGPATQNGECPFGDEGAGENNQGPGPLN